MRTRGERAHLYTIGSDKAYWTRVSWGHEKRSRMHSVRKWGQTTSLTRVDAQQESEHRECHDPASWRVQQSDPRAFAMQLPPPPPQKPRSDRRPTEPAQLLIDASRQRPIGCHQNAQTLCGAIDVGHSSWQGYARLYCSVQKRRWISPTEHPKGTRPVLAFVRRVVQEIIHRPTRTVASIKLSTS